MKNHHLIEFIGIFLLSFLNITIAYAQENERVVGTIGNEKMGNDKIVICVYGSAACMPVNVDTSMTVIFNGHAAKITQLPFGLYIDARIVRDAHGKDIVKEIKINENKTVICFSSLRDGQDKQLDEILSKIKGVKNFKFNNKSNQVYIEFDHKIVTYLELEGKIKKAGYNLE
jgi:hypothetical protein